MSPPAGALSGLTRLFGRGASGVVPSMSRGGRGGEVPWRWKDESALAGDFGCGLVAGTGFLIAVDIFRIDPETYRAAKFSEHIR